jgi:DNA-binding CsgD family transcriptional regulator
VGGDGALLERDHELGVLDGLLGSALAGGPALALIEGPPGIGKSRLLAAACERARQAGCRILRARGSDLERDLPFGVVRQLFESALADPEGRARWLKGPAAGATRVFEPPREEHAAGDVSFGVLHGLFWLTANIAAEGPLLLAVDDLHWCDPSSLRFVAYLERRLEGLQVLIVATVRTGELDAEPGLLGEIAGDPAAVPVRPEALSQAAVAELVRERLGPAEPSFSAACHQATGGNPLLVGELLKTMQTEGVPPDAAHVDVIRDIGPRAVSRAVLLRLARLPKDAAAVAQALAVLGDGAGLSATAALAGLDEPRVAAATRSLVRAEILRAEPPLGFVHPLVRDAVYHELAPPERELCHERAARILTDLGRAPEQVAAHLLAVRPRAEPWIAALLREAGLAAGRRGDADSAVAFLRRALEEPAPDEQRPQLLLEVGLAEAGANAPAAARHLNEAYDRLGDPRQRALAARMLTLMLLFTQTAQEAVRVARRALADLPAEYAGPRRALEAFELYAVAFGATVPDAAARLASARRGGVGAGVGGKMLSAVAAWDWALAGGSAQECSELALAVLADGALVAADPGFGAIIAGGVLGLADRDEALGVWDAAMSEAHRLGSLRTVCIVNIWSGWTWLQRGELAEAEDALRQAHEQIGTLEENGAGTAYVVASLARVLVERGDLPGARAVIGAAPRPSPGSDADGLLRRSLVELLIGEGSWGHALAEAEEYHARLRGVDNPAWAPWRSLRALALEGLGRRDEALALVEEELSRARQWGAPVALGRALRLLGTMRRGEGLDALYDAVDATQHPAARLEHAKALIALGSALRRMGQRSDAREPLRLGVEIAGRRGAEALARYGRTELHAAGGRPRREALSGPESLTPSERRVATLAADAKTNREIAQILYVTPKTVEVHLTSIYRKLGISARTALRGALTRSGRYESILGGPSLNVREGILGIIPMCGRPGRGHAGAHGCPDTAHRDRHSRRRRPDRRPCG